MIFAVNFVTEGYASVADGWNGILVAPKVCVVVVYHGFVSVKYESIAVTLLTLLIINY